MILGSTEISGLRVGSAEASKAYLGAAEVWASGFNLLSLTPDLWLDGSDESTLYDATSGGSLVSVNGTIARWEDKSSNGNHATQSTSGSRPIRRSATAMNSLGAVDFATSRSMTLTNPSPESGTQHTFMFVIRRTAGDTNAILTTSGLSTEYAPFWYNDGTIYYNPDGGFLTASSPATGNHLLVGTSGASTATIRLDGTQVSTLSASAGGTYVDTIGQRIMGGEYHNNLMGEIAIFARVLDSSEMAAAESYLMAKWGIS